MSIVEIKRRGMMFILSSPSGAGKTTLSKALLAKDSLFTLSISATTRPKRPNEQEGIDYHFINEETFQIMKTRGDFLETAHVFGYSYGTPRRSVEEALEKGQDVLFDIDWQGTQQLAEVARADLVTVFILPPSLEELERRLNKRSQDSEETVRLRMAQATNEISHWNEYDYILINQDFEESLGHLQAIVHSERLKRHRQKGLSNFVTHLMESGQQ